MCDYLRDILPAEMRSVVRSFLDPLARIRLVRTCTLLAKEDAAFVTLPPVLAAYAAGYPAMDDSTRASMRVFFLDLLSVRHLPVMAWVFSLADGVSVRLIGKSRLTTIDISTRHIGLSEVVMTELRVAKQANCSNAFVSAALTIFHGKDRGSDIYRTVGLFGRIEDALAFFELKCFSIGMQQFMAIVQCGRADCPK